MTADRPVTVADIWAAARGCGMHKMTRDELLALHDEHRDNPLFASRVIAEAALQIRAMHKAMGIS